MQCSAHTGTWYQASAARALEDAPGAVAARRRGKKKIALMEKFKPKFVEGCRSEHDIDEAISTTIWDQIAFFAEYGFNKSHSAAYGLIAYQTAWLKTNHPVEFMAALLTADGDNTDKVVRFIGESRAMGITVLPPSVNESGLDFTVSDGAIRFGMGAIKGVRTWPTPSVEATTMGPSIWAQSRCPMVTLSRIEAQDCSRDSSSFKPCFSAKPNSAATTSGAQSSSGMMPA
mgnify:CR=1 FL=1